MPARHPLTRIIPQLVVLALGAVLSGTFFLLFSLTNLSGSRIDTPFALAHQRAVRSFVDSQGFGQARLQHSHYWNEYSIRYEGHSYHTEAIRLIGLTSEYGNLYHDTEFPVAKESLHAAASRTLTAEEYAAVEMLRNGATSVTLDRRDSSPGLRVLAPLALQTQCQECHTGEIGKIVGAFDYRLAPTSDGSPTLPNTAPDLPENRPSGWAPNSKVDLLARLVRPAFPR